MLSLLLFLSSAMVYVAMSQKNNFSFGAAGDYASGMRFLATADAAKEAQVDFMLGLGDLAYTANKVRDCS